MDHPIVQTERAEVAQWVTANLDSAPDERELPRPEAELWHTALSLASVADEALLDRLHRAALARGSAAVVQAINSQWQRLEQPDRVEWGDFPVPPMGALAVALARANDVASLRAAFEPSPEARAYPWVIDRVIKFNLATAYAEFATEFPEPHQRLNAWNGVWDALDEERRDTLWSSVLTAIHDDREAAGAVWWSWLRRMSTEQVREEWAIEVRRQREQRRFEVLTPFSAPLGCAALHATAYLDALSWFGDPSAED